MNLQDFLSQSLQAIQQLGGIPFVAKVAIIVGIIISSMKVSVLNDMIWKKLGALQAWVAPILGLVGGILALSLNGGKINLPNVFAYVSAGAGAILLHELLDSIKGLPGIGNVWVSLINAIESALGGGNKAVDSPKVDALEIPSQ